MDKTNSAQSDQVTEGDLGDKVPESDPPLEENDSTALVKMSDVVSKSQYDSAKFPRVPLKLGEILLKRRVINAKQLYEALEKQKNTIRQETLGNTLVKLGYVSHRELRQEILQMGRIGELLVKHDLITRSQLRRALARQEKKTYKALLGDVLIEMGFITEDQLERVSQEFTEQIVESNLISKEQLETAKKEMAKSKRQIPLGSLLVEMGFLTESQLVAAISRYAQIPFLRISNYLVSKEVISLVAPVMAWRLKIIPLNQIGNVLTIAMVNPLDYEGMEELEKTTGFRINRVLCTERDFNMSYKRYYEPAPGWA